MKVHKNRDDTLISSTGPEKPARRTGIDLGTAVRFAAAMDGVLPDLGLFRVIGQPSLDFSVDCDQSARFGINVSDVQDAIQSRYTREAIEKSRREANSRCVAVKYSVRGRDLGSSVEEAKRKVNAAVKLPNGYTIDSAGEYENQKRTDQRLLVVLPVTILLIFFILYVMFNSLKWSLLILTNVAMARIGGLLALLDHSLTSRPIHRPLPSSGRSKV